MSSRWAACSPYATSAAPGTAPLRAPATAPACRGNSSRVITPSPSRSSRRNSAGRGNSCGVTLPSPSRSRRPKRSSRPPPGRAEADDRTPPSARTMTAVSLGLTASLRSGSCGRACHPRRSLGHGPGYCFGLERCPPDSAARASLKVTVRSPLASVRLESAERGISARVSLPSPAASRCRRRSSHRRGPGGRRRAPPAPWSRARHQRPPVREGARLNGSEWWVLPPAPRPPAGACRTPPSGRLPWR